MEFIIMTGQKNLILNVSVRFSASPEKLDKSKKRFLKERFP